MGMDRFPGFGAWVPSLAGVEEIGGVAALSGRYEWYGVLLGSRTATPGLVAWCGSVVPAGVGLPLCGWLSFVWWPVV
ncbi:hypothetical protein [Bifidobacterium tsurumiense]|uniref:hypothetical protein n=1 Tax=Bifidobacterium tsurumiense TaxID=356829 RepID=UPI001269F51C|nr:hypothetical protein [Bifidobacterium tsurumiense]